MLAPWLAAVQFRTVRYAIEHADFAAGLWRGPMAGAGVKAMGLHHP